MIYAFLFIFASLHALTVEVRSYKILGVFPFPSRSHFGVIEPVLVRLAELGHDVAVYSPYPLREPVTHYHDFDISRCSLTQNPARTMTIDDMASIMSNPLLTVFFLSTMSNVTVDKITDCGPLANLLSSNETYDLLITESFTYDVMLMYANKFHVPFVTFLPNSLLPQHFDRMANPSNPAYVPVMLSSLVSPLNLWNRFYNTLLYLTSVGLHNHVTLKQNDETVKALLGPDAPSLRETILETSIFFSYTHPSLNPITPLVPSIIEIAGTHIKPPKALPPNIEKFINESKDGVVYFCMGSVLKGESFTAEKRDAFLYAFSKIPQRVLWKWEGEDLPGKPDNVMISKWMPQRDILAHPNIKLFVSHCGLMGVSEAIYEGVPILGIPIFGDQKGNIKLLKENGAGELLDYFTISKEMVLEKIQKIVSNSKYKENAQKLSNLYRDRPMSPIDTATYWIEYVIRHKGAPHLKTAAVNMPWYQYLLLDVIALVILALVGALVFSYYICKTILRYIMNSFCRENKLLVKSTKKEKKNN